MDGQVKSISSKTMFFVDKNKLGGGYRITMLSRKAQRPLSLTPGAHDKGAKKNVRNKVWIEECSDSSKKGGSTLGFKRHKSKTVVQQATLRGQVVIARDETIGIYYEGVVTSTPTPRCAVVKRSYDGMVSSINTRFLLPVRGAISIPSLRTGDYVLVQVLSVDDSRESYVPGRIQLSSNSASSCLSTVILFNKQTIVTARRHIVKISKERFDFTVQHICREPVQEINPYRYLGVQTGMIVQNKTTQAHVRRQGERRGAGGGGAGDVGDDGGYHETQVRQKGERGGGVDDGGYLEVQERQQGETSGAGGGGSVKDDGGYLEAQGETTGAGGVDDGGYLEVQERQQGETRGAEGVDDGGYLETQVRRQGEKLKELQTDLHEQSDQHRRSQQAIKRKIKLLEKDLMQENNQGSIVRAGNGVNHPQKKKTEDDTMITLALLEMRIGLPQINEQEEVLARWSNEGWYYRGVIKADCEDFSYLVMDSTGEVQQTWREDILTESNDAYENLMKGDTVIALHPDYSFMYAPALVTAIFSEFTIQVLFYNNVITELHQSEIYKIPKIKYNHEVTELRRKENLWKGHSVVTRKDNSGVYQIGRVLEKLEDKHLFRVQWHDGTVCEQQQRHIFGAFTRRHKVTVGDRILGVQNTETYTYLPGNIINEENGKMIIKFCDGSQGVVRPEECYWLSETYFDEAVQYFYNSNSEVLHKMKKNQ